MSLRLILSPRAQEDVDDIWQYSAMTWSPAQADSYLTGLANLMQLLCHQPGLGRLRLEFRPAFRIHPYRSHAVFYHSTSDAIEVVRILASRSNWRAILID